MVIDYVFSGNPANAVSVIFQVDQPGFLAGLSSAVTEEICGSATRPRKITRRTGILFTLPERFAKIR
jgi:basic membrane lipoprotein Med (substrate-binding protein (PBP1-ABC) superfamily)